MQGRAVRGGSPRGGVSLGLAAPRPREPPRAQGARYALMAMGLKDVRCGSGPQGGTREGLDGEGVSRQAAEGERRQKEDGGGQDEEEDVGGVDAHGELLRGGG